MEPRFGSDFSRVRVHDDGHAAASARAVGALAYAVGSHVVFDTQQYAPGTPAGRHLLAHELAHTLQDRSEEHTSELQSLMRHSYAVFCLKQKQQQTKHTQKH